MTKPKSNWETFAFISGIGIHFIIVIGLCVFIGIEADEYFSSTPFGTVSGIFLGVITAVYTAYKRIKDVNR